MDHGDRHAHVARGARAERATTRSLAAPKATPNDAAPHWKNGRGIKCYATPSSHLPVQCVVLCAEGSGNRGGRGLLRGGVSEGEGGEGYSITMSF